MDDAAREALEREMVNKAIAAWNSCQNRFDQAPMTAAIAAAEAVRAKHLASVGRELTPGQRQVLREFRNLAQMFGETSICSPTPDEVWKALLDRAGPELFMGPQPEREALAAYDGPDRVVWEPQRWKETGDAD